MNLALMDCANIVDLEFSVDRKVLFYGWWVYSYYVFSDLVEMEKAFPSLA